MQTIRTGLVTLLVAICAGTTATPAGTEKDIPLSKVPKRVLAAAAKAVPGIKLTEAEIQKTPKGIVYEIEGIAGGRKYEINIAADGKVLRTHQDDDDEADGEASRPDDEKGR